MNRMLSYIFFKRVRKDIIVTGNRFNRKSEIRAKLSASMVAQIVKNLPAMQENPVPSIHGLGRSPEEENGNPLQYSCLGNPKDRGAWWATAHGVAKS